MRNLTFDLMQLCRRNKDGSEGTRAERRKTLRLMSDQLAMLGYKKMRAHDLKGRHVNKLLAWWESQGIAVNTIRNRLAVLRWWAEKVDKADVVARDNAHYGIPARSYRHENRARDITDEVLDRIDGVFADRMRLSLRLQRHFGFRREESLKFSPSYATRRNADGVITSLYLKSSWTKGGRPRTVPVRTAAQRELVEEVAQLVGNQSLIAPSLTYVKYLHKFEYRTRKAGLDRKHGLRHLYAQERYRELTGWPCPLAGGGHLTREQVETDGESRDLISRELGHERRAIVNAYLGTRRVTGNGRRTGPRNAQVTPGDPAPRRR
jgi:hypothetical protein